MKRLAVVFLIMAIILIGATLLLNTCDRGTGEPSASSARYLITADNREYYTNDYSQGIDKYGQYIVLNGYWSYSKAVWKYDSQSFYLSYRGFKEVKITPR
jgi:hypothetical protein